MSFKKIADTSFKGMNNIFENQKSKFYMEKSDCEKKTISCTEDGARANFRYSGALLQLKATWNWLITIHCVNHCIETFDILEI